MNALAEGRDVSYLLQRTRLFPEGRGVRDERTWVDRFWALEEPSEAYAPSRRASWRSRIPSWFIMQCVDSCDEHLAGRSAVTSVTDWLGSTTRFGYDPDGALTRTERPDRSVQTLTATATGS